MLKGEHLFWGGSDMCGWLLPKYPTLQTEFEIENFHFFSLQPSR